MGAEPGGAMGTDAPVTALVPMKARSVRVPSKNVREVGGSPLFYHVVSMLEKCETIAGIAVDTDSDDIKHMLRTDFPDVFIIDRLPELAGSDVPMNDVIAHDIGILDGDVFLQTHSTNPLLRSETVDGAVRAFLSQDEHDSFFSVHPVRKRFYDVQGRAVNHDPAVLLNTQDLPPLYEENSCFYLFTRGSFQRTGHRIGESSLMYEIDPREAVDIDEELDLLVVEGLMTGREG